MIHCTCLNLNAAPPPREAHVPGGTPTYIVVLARSMSSFKSKSFKGSLARSYAALSQNNEEKDEVLAASQASSSAVAGVKEKITAKQERDLERGGSLQASLPVAINGKPEAVNGKDSPSLATVESLDSALGASAITQTTISTECPEADDGILGEKEKAELAKALLDPQELWKKFFSVCIEDAAEAVEENVGEGTVMPSHMEETHQAQKRGEHRFATVCNFPLKLIFTPLKRGRRMANTFASLLEMQFGPLHAALQVGSVILEWNDSSLVAPYLCDYEDEIMRLDMQPHSEWVKYTGKHHTKIKTAIDGLDYGQQIELIYKIASEKKRLIDALIGVIIRYNKYYYYNLFDRNCQHFVADALKALEVELPKEFKGGLGGYYKALIKGRTPSVPAQFKKHSDLDLYVMQKRQEGLLVKMPQHDLEYILALYFRFHLEEKTKLKGDQKALENWTCPETRCCAKELEGLINDQSMTIHQFKTISY